jgi:hypothetical protein
MASYVVLAQVHFQHRHTFLQSQRQQSTNIVFPVQNRSQSTCNAFINFIFSQQPLPASAIQYAATCATITPCARNTPRSSRETPSNDQLFLAATGTRVVRLIHMRLRVFAHCTSIHAWHQPCAASVARRDVPCVHSLQCACWLAPHTTYCCARRSSVSVDNGGRLGQHC